VPDTGWAKRAAERRTSPTCFPVRGHSVESREVPRFMSKVKLGRHVSEDSQLTYTSERSSGSVNECISEYRSLFLFFFYFLIFLFLIISEQFPSTSSTHAGCRRGGGLNRCPLPIREALPPPSAPGEKFAGCAPQLRDPQQMLRYGNGSLHACMPVCA